jgi:hypothetical protein
MDETCARRASTIRRTPRGACGYCDVCESDDPIVGFKSAFYGSIIELCAKCLKTINHIVEMPTRCVCCSEGD